MHFLLLKLSSFVGLQPTQFLERYGDMSVEEVLDLWGFPDFGQTEQEMNFLETNRHKTITQLFEDNLDSEPQIQKTRRRRKATADSLVVDLSENTEDSES
ncbi:MAG: hypothetical protein QXP51_05500 [Candidatus Hadarchaeales archaeon]